MIVEALRWWQLDPVVALEREVFGPESWSAETFWSELAQVATRHYVAAWDDGALAGYAGLAATRDDAWVQTIAVAPEARRRGLGDTLLADLETAARAAGAPTISLEVRADNDDAQRLYLRHGYAVSGRRRGYYQPAGVDALIMVAAL
jgi:ribosomal-protein-alanine N-acetyltransferase